MSKSEKTFEYLTLALLLHIHNLNLYVFVTFYFCIFFVTLLSEPW